MKKLIQFCSLLSLVVVFAAASANAQANYGSEVSIPFKFEIANKTYEAGTYIVKLTKLPTGSATLYISDEKNGSSQLVLLSSNGERSTGEVKLVFETIGSRKVLTHVQTPGDTFAMIRSKGGDDAGAAAEVAGEAGLF